MSSPLIIEPGRHRGVVQAPPSKSHEHRLLIANFLAGDREFFEPCPRDNDDILATKRCLRALAASETEPSLDCGESGSTLRFLSPVAAALGKRPHYLRRGRLAERPFRDYASLSSGLHELPGDVSSQFASGLLFALPLLIGDSRICFTSPLQSRGYVDMTIAVLEKSGIEIGINGGDLVIPGGQRYRLQEHVVEGDWSGAAAWFAMNALGSDVRVEGLSDSSVQPDRVIARLLPELPEVVDVSQCPDLFPMLAVVSAALPRVTVFIGIERLRLKECDRVLAMETTLAGFGVRVRVSDRTFEVYGTSDGFAGGEFKTFGDHRIAMAIAVGATRAKSSVAIDDASCVSKSYPDFFLLHSATL